MAAPILVITGPSGAGKTTIGRLVSATFDPSAYIRIDDFTPFVVKGWIEPRLPEADHQNHVLGAAVAMAAIQFAEGGYAVVVEGHFFPAGLQALAHACTPRGVPLHYAVLRTDLATCVARVAQRSPGHTDDPESLGRLYARFTNLGHYEAHVIDAAGPPDEVATAMLSAFSAGRLADVSTA